MPLKTVSTIHKAGFEQYGHQTLPSWVNWPGEIVAYTEGFDLASERVVGRRVEDLPRLEAFKKKWSRYRTPDWRYDVIRFSNKVFAACDALRDHNGLGVWLDADVLMHQPLSEDYLRSLLPADCYIALFQREGMHSETGLWLVDCTHEYHKPFMDALLAWYESGNFQKAHEWHDCIVMDSTIRAFTKRRLIDVYNLTTAKSNHPMAKHPIAKYMDHLKGPMRKQLGRSPECVIAT